MKRRARYANPTYAKIYSKEEVGAVALKLAKAIKKLKPVSDLTQSTSWLHRHSPSVALLLCIASGPWRIERRSDIQRKAMIKLAHRDISELKPAEMDSVFPLDWQRRMVRSAIKLCRKEQITLNSAVKRLGNKNKDACAYAVGIICRIAGVTSVHNVSKVLLMFVRDYLNIDVFPADRHVKSWLKKHGIPNKHELIVLAFKKLRKPARIYNRAIFGEHASNHMFPSNFGKPSARAYGVGMTDIEVVDGFGFVLASYRAWSGMLERCYCPALHKKQPTYVGCTVAKEWHVFSTFKSWYDKHYRKGYQLDKDILKTNNKVYSPSTCCFVPQAINALFTLRKRFTGKYPIGVMLHTANNRLRVRMSKYGLGMVDLGSFSLDELDMAKQCYLNAKADYVIEVTNEHKQAIDRRTYLALMRKAKEIRSGIL